MVRAGAWTRLARARLCAFRGNIIQPPGSGGISCPIDLTLPGREGHFAAPDGLGEIAPPGNHLGDHRANATFGDRAPGLELRPNIGVVPRGINPAVLDGDVETQGKPQLGRKIEAARVGPGSFPVGSRVVELDLFGLGEFPQLPERRRPRRSVPTSAFAGRRAAPPPDPRRLQL